MSREHRITMHFGGGSLYLKCHDCNKEIAAQEVDFPGTPQQQKIPRDKLEAVRLNHLQTTSI